MNGTLMLLCTVTIISPLEKSTNRSLKKSVVVTILERPFKVPMKCFCEALIFIFSSQSQLVVPHITDTIQDWVERVARISVDDVATEPDICIIEVKS